MTSVVLVVPCYNEAGRWSNAYWREIAEDRDLQLIFVNDGSTDATRDSMAATCDEIGAQAIDLPLNVGKGEAVRQGLQSALARGAVIVGYLDADGAFPSTEVVRLAAMSRDLLLGDTPDFDSLWAARVLMAGRRIKRRASRHYIGRVVATAIAPFHRYEVYDTQSGYKLFRADGPLTDCLRAPFGTRWFVDVEIIQRWANLSGRPMRIWEEPVTGWYDVAGSKLTGSQYGQLVKDMSRLYRSRVRPRASRS